MGLHGARADGQERADLDIRVAVGDKLQHLALACGQPIVGVGVGARQRGVGAQALDGQRRAEEPPPLGDASNRADELAAGRFL